MKLSDSETSNPQMLPHIFEGLTSDGLINHKWIGGRGDLENNNPLSDNIGIVCEPTANGAELFLWGFGCGSQRLSYILSSEFSTNVDGLPSMFKDAIPQETT